MHPKTASFNEMLQNGNTIDDTKVEAFAVVRETAKLVLGLQQYQQGDPTRIYQKEDLEIFFYTYSKFEKEMCLYIARHLIVPQNA